MGEIRKINRETGEDMGVVGDIEANEIAGRPFICVYGVSRPRVAGEKKIVEKAIMNISLLKPGTNGEKVTI